jgi:hypothetical protein
VDVAAAVVVDGVATVESRAAVALDVVVGTGASGHLFLHSPIISKMSSTANEGPVRIQYKCLLPIYVFPEMKLLFPKTQLYIFLSPSFLHLYICERFIYI